MQGYIDGVETAFGTPPFKPGDKVVLKNRYYNKGANDHKNRVIRKVLSVRKSGCTPDGWLVDVDGGEPCKCCGLTPANSLSRMGSGWFIKAEV